LIFSKYITNMFACVKHLFGLLQIMNRILHSQKELNEIKNILLNGGVIAFPTDTVWGIGCLINKKNAIDKIYELKGRDRSKPLILLSDDINHIKPYVANMPKKAEELITKFMPGALTVVLDKNQNTPLSITANMDTIGFRIPNNSVIIEILKFCTDNHVLATTSANLSGEGAFSKRENVVKSIGDKIDYIDFEFDIKLEGKESTVLYVNSSNEIKVYRQGAVFID
jgi:L-threonylcarbamoyladenylate synthase